MQNKRNESKWIRDVSTYWRRLVFCARLFTALILALTVHADILNPAVYNSYTISDLPLCLFSSYMASTSTECTGAEDSAVRIPNTSINFEGQVPSIPGPQMLSSPTLGTEAAVSGTSTSVVLEGTQANYPKDKDKSLRSLSTTVKTRTSRRRTNKSSTSENAPSSSTHVEKPAVISRSAIKEKAKVYYGTRSPKPSFFAKLARKLVPCTGTSRMHPLDVDDKGSGISDLGSSKEKQGLKDVDKESGPSHLSKATIDSSPAPSPADTSSSLPLAPSNPVTIISLSPAADSDIIIPPSKQLLPESETEGVTSGAVQPPGSTGDRSE